MKILLKFMSKNVLCSLLGFLWFLGLQLGFNSLWVSFGIWCEKNFYFLHVPDQFLACCGSWGHKESDTTEWLNWTELTSFPRLYTENTVFSSLYIYFLCCRWIYHKCMSLFEFSDCRIDLSVLFVTALYCFDYCSFIVQSEVRKHDTSILVLFSQNFLGYSRSFVVPYKF